MNTTSPATANLQSLRRQALAGLAAHWKAFLAQGILMVLLGALAVLLPVLASLEIELLIGWLFIIGGLVRGSVIFRKQPMPGRWWAAAGGLAAVVIGALLVARPIQGVLSLTLLMAVVFFVEGIAGIFMAVELRKSVGNWAFTLFAALVNLLLVGLIWSGWPGIAGWVLGLFVGVNLVCGGIPLIMTAIASRPGHRGD